jgi:hypothetical protein
MRASETLRFSADVACPLMDFQTAVRIRSMVREGSSRMFDQKALRIGRDVAKNEA